MGTYTQNHRPDLTQRIHSPQAFPTNDSRPHLPTPDLGSRRSVRSRNRVVNVDQDSRVGSLVSTREANQRSGVTTAATGNLDLGTADVELGTARRTGRVEGNVLDAEEVLARRQRLGDGDRDLLLAVRGPAELAAVEGRALLVELEPHVAAAVPVGGRLAGGHLGHVELEGAWVRDGGLRGEAEGGAGGDFVGLDALAGVELVAADLVGVDLRVRGQYGVGTWRWEMRRAKSEEGGYVHRSRGRWTGSLSSYGHTATDW